LARVYLDIETYRKDKNDAFVREQIIAIGVLEEGLNEPRIFKAWENPEGERGVLKEFYNYIKELAEGHEYIEVVGFNILRFDIPLLTQRLVKHRVKRLSLPQLNFFWYSSNVLVIDLFQLALMLNRMMFSGNRQENLASKLRSICPNIPEPVGESSKIAEAYDRGDYAYIIDHLRADLMITREVYSCLADLADCLAERGGAAALQMHCQEPQQQGITAGFKFPREEQQA